MSLCSAPLLQSPLPLDLLAPTRGDWWGNWRGSKGARHRAKRPVPGPVLCGPLPVFVLLGFLLGFAVQGAAVGPAGLGTVRQQGHAEALSRGWGGHLATLTVPATVAQVVADIGQRVVGPRRLQSQGQVGIRASRQARGGQQALAAKGCAQLPVDCGLSSLGEVRYPGFLVGQRVNEIRRLWPFL